MEGTTSSECVQCPICSKNFVPSAIEAHVSKCLFLNESSEKKATSSLKKWNPAVRTQSKSPLAKRAKQAQSSKSTNKPTSERVLVVENKLESPEKTEVAATRIVETSREDDVPLAEKMRPTSLIGYIGQSHVIGKQSMLLQLLEKGDIPNIILWGPPGCGKTSLANVIAKMCQRAPGSRLRYAKLSAAMSGVADVKAAATIASNELKFGRRTVIFMDEIHRFNKAQQDIFLPHVESGTITLIGATTENPAFSLNSALLSRCRVVVLEKLTTGNLVDILSRAVESLKGIIHVPTESKSVDRDFKFIPRFLIDSRTIQWLAETCDGDARIALGGLELAVRFAAPCKRGEEFPSEGPGLISLEDVQESLNKTHMLYDRKGDQHYDVISALHKSLRASDENASLYWLARMMAGGEDPVYIARRLVRTACEDIGLEDPKALSVAVNTMQGCKMMGMPECDVLLAQCVTYLARAPKSRLMDDAIAAAKRIVAEHKGPQPGVPLHLRNAPAKLMHDIGFDRDYTTTHKDESDLSCLPEGLEDINFLGHYFDDI